MSTARARHEFTRSDPRPAVKLVAEVLENAGQWVNLEPVVDDDDWSVLAVRRGMAGWFSGRGSDLPFVTLVGRTRGRRPDPPTLGVEHGTGPRASSRLTERDVVPPATWRRRQDHAKRGLVYVAEGAPDATETVAFVLDAVAVLSPIELGGQWSAIMHRPG